MNTTIQGDSATPTDATSRWQRIKRQLTLAVRFTLVLAIAAGAIWWFRFSPVAVTRHEVATGTVIAEVMGTGTLEARSSAIVGPKIGGLIVSIVADQGDRVAAGALLFKLEDSDFKQQVGMAESEVAAATAALVRIRADRRRAEAVQTRAKVSHERIAELAAKNVISAEDVDKSIEVLTIADAGLSVASAAIVEAQSRLAVAARSLDYRRARLHDTTIEAPFDGLVVRRDREPGDVVTVGASVLKLVSTDRMWITAWVDETELARLADGQAARVVFRSEPAATYGGVVARIGREADRETREIVADVRVEKLPGSWAVGQRAEVFIEVARRERVTVLPAALLLVRAGRTGVVLDLGGKATWREVKIGLRGRKNLEVTGGLSPGDVVVSPAGASASPLRDGRKIRHK